MSVGSSASNFGNEHVPLSPAAPPDMDGSKGNSFSCLENSSNMLSRPRSEWWAWACPEVAEIKPRGVERAAEPTLEISNMAKKSDARVADIELRIVDVRCVPKDRIFYLGPPRRTGEWRGCGDKRRVTHAVLHQSAFLPKVVFYEYTKKPARHEQTV